MIPNEYLINDKRPIESFKKSSFSGYSMKDVLTIFNKSLLDCKIEESCNWGVELLISGYIVEFFEKIISIGIKNVNINNPKLSYFLYNRFSNFIEIYKTNNTKLLLRNNQQIRNMVCECCFVICNSLKTKSLSLVRIKENDFNMIYIESKLIANKSNLISDKIKYGDPEETKIILNEFNYCLINKKYELCVYWLSWIIEWEKKNTKKNKVYICGYREIQNIDRKYCNDVIWFIWEIILKELDTIQNMEIVKNVHSLYKLYKYDFKPSKKGKRVYYILYALKYFTDSYHFTEVYNNYFLMIQACSNINIIFFEKNKSSINNSQSIEKINYTTNKNIIHNEIKTKEQQQQKKSDKQKLKELKKIADEKMRLKINKVEEIDSLILKNSS